MNQFVLDNQSGKEFESHVPIKRIDVKPTEPVTGQKKSNSKLPCPNLH